MALGDEIKEKLNRKVAGLYLLAENIGKNLEKQAKSNAAWTDRTGNTRRTIHGGADKIPSGATLYLAHGSMVGTYLEEGTGKYGPRKRPYIIRPKNKKVLRFIKDGKEIFAKSVNHPGIKPRPVIDPTVDSNWPKIKQQVRHYWENT